MSSIFSHIYKIKESRIREVIDSSGSGIQGGTGPKSSGPGQSWLCEPEGRDLCFKVVASSLYTGDYKTSMFVRIE